MNTDETWMVIEFLRLDCFVLSVFICVHLCSSVANLLYRTANEANHPRPLQGFRQGVWWYEHDDSCFNELGQWRERQLFVPHNWCFPEGRSWGCDVKRMRCILFSVWYKMERSADFKVMQIFNHSFDAFMAIQGYRIKQNEKAFTRPRHCRSLF